MITLPGDPSYLDKDKQVVTEAALVHLGKLPHLRDVSVSATLTNKGLAHLATLPHLQKLYIRDSKITDEGMRLLGRCTELRELWCGSEEVTDAGLAHLKGLRHLRELHLRHAKITGGGNPSI